MTCKGHHFFCRIFDRAFYEGGVNMKGYYTDGDYWGWIPHKNMSGGRWMRFESDTEYREAYAEATTS